MSTLSDYHILPRPDETSTTQSSREIPQSPSIAATPSLALCDKLDFDWRNETDHAESARRSARSSPKD
jgi:hypothetical protein